MWLLLSLDQDLKLADLLLGCWSSGVRGPCLVTGWKGGRSTAVEVKLLSHHN